MKYSLRKYQRKIYILFACLILEKNNNKKTTDADILTVMKKLSLDLCP